jgi:hypothetical protein
VLDAALAESLLEDVESPELPFDGAEESEELDEREDEPPESFL